MKRNEQEKLLQKHRPAIPRSPEWQKATFSRRSSLLQLQGGCTQWHSPNKLSSQSPTAPGFLGRSIRQSMKAGHRSLKPSVQTWPLGVQHLILISSSQITKHSCTSVSWTTNQLPPLICPPETTEVFKIKYSVFFRKRNYANIRRLIFLKAPACYNSGGKTHFWKEWFPLNRQGFPPPWPAHTQAPQSHYSWC